ARPAGELNGNGTATSLDERGRRGNPRSSACGFRDRHHPGYIRAMRRLLVFARPPVAGQVKSRLSPALPLALAAELYRAVSADAFEALRGSAATERTVWWSEGDDPAPEGFRRRQQQGADLGERLRHAFDETFAAGGGRALVVASDTPA